MFHVTDTHSLLWLLTGNRRLSDPARDALEDAAIPLVVPSIVLAEVRFLHARGRITIDLDTVLSYVDSSTGCSIQAFDEAVARRLSTQLEIHDSIIVATALVLKETTGQDVALVTRDEAIAASGLVPVIW